MTFRSKSITVQKTILFSIIVQSWNSPSGWIVMRSKILIKYAIEWNHWAIFNHTKIDMILLFSIGPFLTDWQESPRSQPVQNDKAFVWSS